MKKKIYTFLSTFIILTKFCWAQADNSSTKDTLVQSNYFYNYNSKSILHHFSLQTDKSFTSNNYNLGNPYLKFNFSDTFFSRPEYYNLLLQRDFSNKFNPTNPWNAANPFEAVMCGSLNYLIREIDRKCFFYK